MAAIIVVGSQWGDEGKGKVVDIYTQFADVVVRFQGGGNAGHTVVIGDKKIILHQIPSGIFHPDKVCIIGNGMVLDLETLMEEIDEVRKNGFFRDPSQLLISDRVHLVFSYHRVIDQGKERKAGEHKLGTTGRGIGPAYENKVARTGIRFIDLFDEKVFKRKLELNLAEKNPYLVQYLEQEGFDAGKLFVKYASLAEKLRPNMIDASVVINRFIQEGKNILFEGAQGTLLDLDHGTYPFVTSSNTAAGAVCLGSGIGPTRIDGVIGIVKAYTTRVGEGPFPVEQTNEVGNRLREQGGEFGATTGRPRRCGWFDAVAVSHANRINGFTGIAVTKLDVLTGMEKIKACRAYAIGGKEVTEFPADLTALERCVPIYEEMDGWDQDLSAIRSYVDLPNNAKRYVELLQDLIGAEICLISVGVERDETIMLKNPFSF